MNDKIKWLKMRAFLETVLEDAEAVEPGTEPVVVYPAHTKENLVRLLESFISAMDILDMGD